MTSVPEIVDLNKVLRPNLNGSQLILHSRRYLTKPGDNYGSIMLAVSTNIKNLQGSIEELQLVAKLPPITNDVYWKVFQPQRTCMTENAVYLELAPWLSRLQLEFGVPESQLFDCFPKFYGARISLDPLSSTVDRDAVLLLENLQANGYRPGDRHKTFDYAHTKLILTNLAKFHGFIIALRQKKPDIFDKKIRPFFKRFNLNKEIDPSLLSALKKQTLDEIKMAVKGDQDRMEIIEKLFTLNEEFINQTDCTESLFSTISHFDLWINNIMIAYDEDGCPCKLKFLDFQVAQYESLAHDIVYFLILSCKVSVVKEHYDEFLKIYYKTFLECLQQMDCSTSEYSFEKFMLEINRVGPIEIPHALYMTKFILADSKTMPQDFKDVDVNLFIGNVASEKIIKRMSDILEVSQKFGYI